MTGRHKFVELEAAMSPVRRARIDRIAERLDRDVKAAPSRGLQPNEFSDQTACCPTYRYQLVYHGSIVHHGITTNPQRRQTEHRSRWPGAVVEVLGPAVTREAALKWRASASRE